MRLTALLAVMALFTFASTASARNVGFTELKIANGNEKPLVIGIWYPTDAEAREQPINAYVQTVALNAPPAGERLPLIVISHGNSGAYSNHFDTALALAKAGFVAAALTHNGDTLGDQSRATFMEDRPKHIRRLIDYMLAQWPGHDRIDPRKVGMFGFSSGGFTTLVMVGGVPDLRLTEAHHRAHPDYYDAQLVSRARANAGPSPKRPNPVWVHDARIRAAVVAAPAMGYVFQRKGLRRVRIPIQLWRAEKDHILPHPDYAEAVRIALPRPPEYHLVKNGDHFDFLPPCSDLLRKVAPQICTSLPGFDRSVFHQRFNREVVRFFEETLR